mmetsp:Transcript_21898/g.39434  ORF Transcript_21898/g.39434 Transcript_21898/m.39434 type:complete len:211 (+) Transcript_21898:834-1466(+)
MSSSWSVSSSGSMTFLRGVVGVDSRVDSSVPSWLLASSISFKRLVSSRFCSLRNLRALITSREACRMNRSYDSVCCITNAHSSNAASTSDKLPTSMVNPQSSLWAAFRRVTISTPPNASPPAPNPIMTLAIFVSSIPNNPSSSPPLLTPAYRSSILLATISALRTVRPNSFSAMCSRRMSTARFSASTCTSCTNAASPSASPRAYATMGR